MRGRRNTWPSLRAAGALALMTAVAAASTTTATPPTVTREALPPRLRGSGPAPSPPAGPAATQPAPEALATGIVGVDEPFAVAFTPAGALLVAAGREGIIELDPFSTERVRAMPAAPGRRFVALAVAGDGSIFAVEEEPGGEGRVVRVDAGGSVVERFGELRRARGIALSADASTVAVADTGNDRVLLFDRGAGVEGEAPAQSEADGAADRAAPRGVTAPPRTIGARGSGDGLFRAPSAVAFDPAGRLYVADADNHRVQRFGRDGRFETAFGSRGAMPGQLERPVALVTDGSTLLVADHYNHRIQRFTEDGDFITLWGMHAIVPREAGGRIHYPVSVAAHDGRGLFAVAEPFERRVQLFRRSTEGEVVPREAPRSLRDGVSSHFGEGIAVDGSLLALWEPEASAVVVFDLRSERPVHVTTFGSPGRRVHEIGRVAAIAADEGSERLWIADVANDRLVEWTLRRDPRATLRFDPFMGGVTRAVDFETLGRSVAALDGGAPTVEPSALAFAPGPGELLLLDGVRERVIRIDGASLEPVGILPGADMGFPRHPTALAVRPDGGAVAILDASDATRLAAIIPLAGEAADAAEVRVVGRPAVIDEPRSIAWIGNERLVVTTGDDRLVILTLDGDVVTAPELHGVDDGRLWHPRGVAGAADGSFFIVDWGNHRVQRFDREGRWHGRFGVGRSVLRPRSPDAVPAIIRPKPGAPAIPRPAPATAAGPFPRRIAAPGGEPALSWRPVDDRGGEIASIPLRDPFFIRITLDEGAGASVDVDASMPHHGHGMNLAPVTRTIDGSRDLLAGPMLFHMPGAWEIYFDLRRDGRLLRLQDDVMLEGGE